MILRSTKIVCTMGPSTNDVEVIKELLKAGMNVARSNFSHGDHEYHREMIRKVREASRQTDIPVALLLDTKGPEIRTGMIKGGGTIELMKHKKIILTTEVVEGTTELLSISYKKLPEEVSPGKHIYIADGLIDLIVEKVEGCRIHCVVHNGGEMGSKKNLNVVGVKTSLPAITEKDEEDILFAIKEKMDFIAASFVRKPQDVLEIQKILDDHNSPIKIIAKIEDEEGLENIDEIIKVSGGVMVARGDLGVQLRTELIPLAQKRIIQKCNLHNKPVITATQMLDSMIYNPKPTRAELTDVANAIFDGTDAVMLSGETASGKFPVKAVETMHNIALTVEESEEYLTKTKSYIEFHGSDQNIRNAIARAANLIAQDINASSILAPTLSGNTAKIISKFRPQQNIIAVTTTETVQRQLLLYWGIYPIITELVENSDEMLINAHRVALKNNLVKNFDKIVTVAGVPLNSPVVLNMIKVNVVCNVLNKGQYGFGKIATGKIVKAKDVSDAVINLKHGGNEILLTPTLDDSFKPLVKNLKGVILEENSTIPLEQLKLINPNLVFISQVPNAMVEFEDNLIVSLNGDEKTIYEGIIESEEILK